MHPIFFSNVPILADFMNQNTLPCLFCSDFLLKIFLWFFYPCLEHFMLFAHLAALSVQLLVKCRSIRYTCSHSCEGFGSPYLIVASWFTVWIWNVELKWLFLCCITYKSTFQDISIIGNPAASCSLCVLKRIEKS